MDSWLLEKISYKLSDSFDLGREGKGERERKGEGGERVIYGEQWRNVMWNIPVKQNPPKFHG